MASQITGVSIVYSTVCSGADQRKHQRSASLAFVQRIHHIKGQWRGKCFHLMTSSCKASRSAAWWRHKMETFSALLAAQRPLTRSFDVFFDLRLNKRLSKQCWGWWFETPSRPLWCHCNGSRPGPYWTDVGLKWALLSNWAFFLCWMNGSYGIYFHFVCVLLCHIYCWLLRCLQTLLKQNWQVTQIGIQSQNVHPELDVLHGIWCVLWPGFNSFIWSQAVRFDSSVGTRHSWMKTGLRVLENVLTLSRLYSTWLTAML